MRGFKEILIFKKLFLNLIQKINPSKNIWAVCETCHKNITKGKGIHQQIIILHPDNGRAVIKVWQWFCSPKCISQSEPYPADLIREWAEKYGYIEGF